MPVGSSNQAFTLTNAPTKSTILPSNISLRKSSTPPTADQRLANIPISAMTSTTILKRRLDPSNPGSTSVNHFLASSPTTLSTDTKAPQGPLSKVLQRAANYHQGIAKVLESLNLTTTSSLIPSQDGPKVVNRGKQTKVARPIPRQSESEFVDVDAPELDRTLESIPRPDSDDELLLEEEYSAPSRKYEFRLRKVRSYNEELDEEEEYEELVLEEVSDLDDQDSDSSISESMSDDNDSEFEDKDQDGLSDEELASGRRSKRRTSTRKALTSDRSGNYGDIHANVDHDGMVFGGIHEAPPGRSPPPTFPAGSSILHAQASPSQNTMPVTDRPQSLAPALSTYQGKFKKNPTSGVLKSPNASLDHHDDAPPSRLASRLPKWQPDLREQTPIQQQATNDRDFLPLVAAEGEFGNTDDEADPIVEVSSSNFEAAARAAEILRLHHDYIQHAAPIEGYQRGESIPRALSRHSSRGNSVSMRDSEADAMLGQTNRPFTSSAGTIQAGVSSGAIPTGTTPNESLRTVHSWSSNDWAVLSRCYEICCKDVDDLELLNYDSVISQFLDETGGSRFSRDDVLKRIVALQARGNGWSRQGSKRPRSGSVSSIGSRASFGMMPPRLHPQTRMESPSLTSGRQGNSISIQKNTKTRRLSSVQPEATEGGLVRRLSALFSGSSPKLLQDSNSPKPNFNAPKPKALSHGNANGSSSVTLKRTHNFPQAGIYPSVPSQAAPQPSTSKNDKSARGLSRLIPWR